MKKAVCSRLRTLENGFYFLPDTSPYVLRHAGVLGLSSCIKAFPYDVPDWMPQMLVEIGNHLHDPNPIQVKYK